jgi:hypothetical protein
MSAVRAKSSPVLVQARADYSVMPMSCSQLKQQLDTRMEKDPFCKSVTLIEVRNRSEIETTGKIKGSVGIPLPSLIEETQRLLADYPKDRKVRACESNVSDIGYVPYLKFVPSICFAYFSWCSNAQAVVVVTLQLQRLHRLVIRMFITWKVV